MYKNYEMSENDIWLGFGTSAHAWKLSLFELLCQFCVEHLEKATKESGLVFHR